MTKCAAFWKHTNVRGDNRIFPCCRFKQPIDTFKGNLIEILNSEQYKELRRASSAGEKISGCEKCYYEESNGKESLRQRFNNEYDTDTVSLEFLEIGFDNICNLTCDGCWSEFSSAWSKKTYNIMQYTSVEEIVEVPDTIRKVLFLGGEPLMTNRHETFLKLISAPNNVELVYNTNGTFLLKESVILDLKKFKSVKFILSIDGYGDLNDRVRSGSKWADILEFITQVKQLNFLLEINTVIHLNNWHGILELEKFINNLDVPWTTNILTYPKNLDIVNYKNKQEIIDTIKHSNIPNREYIIKHLS